MPGEQVDGDREHTILKVRSPVPGNRDAFEEWLSCKCGLKFPATDDGWRRARRHAGVVGGRLRVVEKGGRTDAS